MDLKSTDRCENCHAKDAQIAQLQQQLQEAKNLNSSVQNFIFNGSGTQRGVKMEPKDGNLPTLADFEIQIATWKVEKEESRQKIAILENLAENLRQQIHLNQKEFQLKLESSRITIDTWQRARQMSLQSELDTTRSRKLIVENQNYLMSCEMERLKVALLNKDQESVYLRRHLDSLGKEKEMETEKHRQALERLRHLTWRSCQTQTEMEVKIEKLEKKMKKMAQENEHLVSNISIVIPKHSAQPTVVQPAQKSLKRSSTRNEHTSSASKKTRI